MTNEETIKEISDALIAQGEERTKMEIENLKTNILVLDALRNIRYFSFAITLVLLLMTIILLASCSHEESKTENFIRHNKEEMAKSQAIIDSIDLELIKLGDGSTKGK